MHLLLDSQSALIKPPGARIVTLGLVHTGEAIERGGDSGVLRAMHGLFDSQSALIEPPGARIVTLGLVHIGEVIEGDGDSGVLRAMHFLFDGQCALKKPPGAGIVTLGLVHTGEVIERGGDLGVLRAMHLLLDSQSALIKPPGTRVVARLLGLFGRLDERLHRCVGRHGGGWCRLRGRLLGCGRAPGQGHRPQQDQGEQASWCVAFHPHRAEHMTSRDASAPSYSKTTGPSAPETPKDAQ